MSDQDTSGEPTPAPATAAGAAPQAASAGDTKPMGSFGTARGSGLARGKRAAAPVAASAVPSVANSGYKPTSVAVITPVREYTHPFASELPAPVLINEPVTQAAPAPAAIVATPAPKPAPVAFSREPAAEMFPYAAPGGNEPKPSSPQPQPAATVEKAELKILPPAEVKRPSVSWGDGTEDEDTRPQPDQRPTFRPERRDGRPAEPREPKAFETREPKPYQGRENKPFQPREPRREGSFQQRNEPRRDNRETPRVTEPVKKSGGFLAWLKGLFGGTKTAPAAPAPSRESREGGYDRQRHRGNRGRGGYQGGQGQGSRDYQPRDPRDEEQGGDQPSRGGDQAQGEQRYEGGGGRRRRRGGRGRGRDDRGGPQSEGQQGGGAI